VFLGSFNRRLGLRREDRNCNSGSPRSQALRHQCDKAFKSECLLSKYEVQVSTTYSEGIVATGGRRIKGGSVAKSQMPSLQILE
jgi:hypothetical protein